MPIKPNKPFNPCPQGQQPCNNNPDDKSCCPNTNPKIVQRQPQQLKPPKARSNLGTATPSLANTKIRKKKNIIRDIVVSGNRPIPKVKYAKDGTKRFHVNEGKRKSRPTSIRKKTRPRNIIQHQNGSGGDGSEHRDVSPCCSQGAGEWYCAWGGGLVDNCHAGASPWTPGGGYIDCGEDAHPDVPGWQGAGGNCRCDVDCDWYGPDDGGGGGDDGGNEAQCYLFNDAGIEIAGCYCWTGAYNNDIHTCVEVPDPYGDCTPYHNLNNTGGQCPPDPGYCHQEDINTWHPHGCPSTYVLLRNTGYCRCVAETAGCAGGGHGCED